VTTRRAWAVMTFSHAAMVVRIRVPHKPIDRER
jgi:hypothetical protein